MKRKYLKPVAIIFSLEEAELLAASPQNETVEQNYDLQKVGDDDFQHVIQLSKKHNYGVEWDSDEDSESPD